MFEMPTQLLVNHRTNASIQNSKMVIDTEMAALNKKMAASVLKTFIFFIIFFVGPLVIELPAKLNN